MRPDRRHLGVLFERLGADERLVEHAGQRVDVGATVDGLSLDLLRRDVVDGADELPCRGEAGLGGRLLGQPEVRDVDVVVLADQDVARLDITMDEPAPVRRVQTCRRLSDDRNRTSWWQRAGAAKQLTQVRAFDVAHGDVENTAAFIGVVHRNDVRVIERGGQLRLP